MAVEEILNFIGADKHRSDVVLSLTVLAAVLYMIVLSIQADIHNQESLASKWM